MRKKCKVNKNTNSRAKKCDLKKDVNATNLSTEIMRPFTKKIKLEDKQANQVRMFPKESKNIPKNLCRALKYYIGKLISDQQIKSNQILQSFMSKKTQLYSKDDLDCFLQTKLGRQIGDRFFGNQAFAIIFIRENKVYLDSYFRILDKYFLPYTSQKLNQITRV